MSWEYHNNNLLQQEVDILGLELSNHIHCAVRYPVYDKHIFECHCVNENREGITFPVFAVAGAHESGDWAEIIKRHEEGNKLDGLRF
jgi:hypothetical protein